MTAIATISTIAVLIFLCGYRAHGALLQLVLSCLGRVSVGAVHDRDCHNIDDRGVDFSVRLSRPWGAPTSDLVCGSSR